MTLSSLLLALLPVSSADPQPQDASVVSGSVSLEAVRPRLVSLMRAGIDVKQPNNGWFLRMERESVFDGSFDWHSCVIAHWALLVEARRSGDDELEAFVTARLTGEAIEAEGALLSDRDRRRQITFPYDEAWFLMLLSELGGREEMAEVVAPLRSQVEGRLLEWLEENPFPEGVPDVGYCGFYRSWLFTYLLVQVSGPVTEGAPERLAELRATRIEPVREELAAREAGHPWDFLWLPAILALVDRTAPEAEPAAYEPGPAKALPESVTIQTVHRLGVTLSRVWPCAWDASRGDEQARETFENRVHALLEREDLWAEDFTACSHWMPQYLWLGLWFADGCP